MSVKRFAKRFQWRAVLCIALTLAAVPSALAQREPRIGYVYPAGGQQGTTFDVVIGGQFLKEANNVYVSGIGVQVTVLEQEVIITPKEASELRDKMQELRKQEKRPEVIKEILEVARKLAAFNKRRMAAPAIADTFLVQITMAPDAVPGERELRVRTPTGLSNPLVFQVGQLPEFREPAPKTDDATLLKQLQIKRGGNPPSAKPKPPLLITLPAIVNGQILPGGVDRFRFQARQGQQLVVAANARKLIPYLADAVPGWFQATLALCDANGKELAFDDDYRFNPDPVLFYKIPSDGEYVLEIHDSIYRGREDFVYRISVGELPFVESIFPLGGKAGTQATVEIRGWNLPIAKQTLDLKDKTPGVLPFSVRGKEQISNNVPFAVDTLPESFDKEPNNSPNNAQPVTLPIIINGRVNQPGDVDVFRFEGRAGDQIVAEVYARRLDSPVDSALKLTDATGKQLTFNDDCEDKASGLNTHHADSYLTATLADDGTYYLQLSDTQRKGGSAYTYRLRVSAPRPDFELRIVPSSISARAGVSVPLTVFALRKDGFSGEIQLALKDAPAGFKLDAAKIPANQDKVKITLTAPPMPKAEPLSLHIEGRATVQGREVVRPAVPTDDMMQAFLYRHLVPAQSLEVVVAKRFMPWASAKILSATPVKIPVGGEARIEVSVPPTPNMAKVEFELAEPPEGITIKNVSPLRETTEIVLQTDAAKIKPGLKGNLIVKASGERQPPPGDEAPKGNRRRIPLGALPAIPFEVVQP